MSVEILSVGHGTLEQDEFLWLLQSAGVQALVDVRSRPGSQRYPHFGQGKMRRWLPAAGIVYGHMPELGGFRPYSPQSDADVAWRNKSFRHYAGYTRDPAFVTGIDTLAQHGRFARVAYMCSEADPNRCHRRIISDFLVCARDVRVLHLMHDGRLTLHMRHPALRVRPDGLIVYDGGQLL